MTDEPAPKAEKPAAVRRILDPALPASVKKKAKWNAKLRRGEKLDNGEDAVAATATMGVLALMMLILPAVLTEHFQFGLSIGAGLMVMNAGAVTYWRRRKRIADRVLTIRTGEKGGPEGVLAGRASNAIEKIEALEVWKSGKLDPTARLDLDTEEGEIFSHALALQTLRKNLAKQRKRLTEVPEALEVLTQQEEALERSSAELEARISALEKYTEELHRLEAQGHTLEALEGLGENDRILTSVFERTPISGGSEPVQLSTLRIEAAREEYTQQLELLRGLRSGLGQGTPLALGAGG